MCGLSGIQFLDRLVESDTFDVISAHSTIFWLSTFQTEIVDICIFNISVITLYLMVVFLKSPNDARDKFADFGQPVKI